MIVARKEQIENEKCLTTKFFGEGYNISYDESDILFVMENENEVIGISKVRPLLTLASGILEYISIDQNKRGEMLGDGLLRAILNYCKNHGIRRVYFNGVSDYLAKKGFSLVDVNNLPLELSHILKKDIVLECDLENFFSGSCCSKRGCGS